MAFNLLLQLLRIETLCSSEASLRGCLDEILCLPLKTRVKSCPHCQKQNDQCDLPSHPRSIGYLLNHQFSHFQFLMQILHIQLHSWILGNQGVNFLWQLWILLLYFLATFAETNKKIKRHHYMYYGSADVHVINLRSCSSEQQESQKCHI